MPTAIPPFQLIKDQRDRLTLKRPGHEDLHDVRIRRAFPLSDPDAQISIRTSEGKELLLIEDLSALEPNLRGLIEQTLKQTSFVPQIQKVDDVDVRFGYQQWKVQTTSGPAEFRVQEREDIRFLADGRFRIKDADGNVYEMPPLAKLDERSRRAIATLV